jgi:hypothetical protein
VIDGESVEILRKAAGVPEPRRDEDWTIVPVGPEVSAVVATCASFEVRVLDRRWRPSYVLTKD